MTKHTPRYYISSTILVEPGWRAEITEYGDVALYVSSIFLPILID